MRYLARLSYNSANWQRPTRDAQAQEEEGTYNQTHGFGHEDWLFRNDWLIDGWRYGFIQGVNRSHAKLVEANEPFDLTLFTIDEQKGRRYIATIHAAECLDDKQAEKAVDVFQSRGWITTMRQEITDVGGDDSALGAVQWAKHVLNVRFRLDNVCWFPNGTYATTGDPILQLNRYTLCDLDKIESKESEATVRRSAANTGPSILSHMRRACPAVECTPEHAMMQKKLLAELAVEFPSALIECERDFIDVSVQTPTELLLFEIKSDLEPRAVIRQALGQILEYGFYPSRTHELPVRLFIAGRQPLTREDQAYLKRLQTDFSLPLDYRVVPL